MVVNDDKFNEAQVQVLQRKVLELFSANLTLETQVFLLRSELHNVVLQNEELKAAPEPNQNNEPNAPATPGP